MDIESLKQLNNLKTLVTKLSKKIDFLEVKTTEIKIDNSKKTLFNKSVETDLTYLTSTLKKLDNKVNAIILKENLMDNTTELEEINVCENGHVVKGNHKFCPICGSKVHKTKRIKTKYEKTKKVNYVSEKESNVNEKYDKAIVNILLKKASTAFNLKDFKSALKNYQEVLNYDFNNYTANFNAGISAYTLKKYTKAITFFKNIINIDKNSKDAYIYLGIIYYRIADYDNAQLIWKKLLDIDPKNEIAIQNLNKIRNIKY